MRYIVEVRNQTIYVYQCKKSALSTYQDDLERSPRKGAVELNLPAGALNGSY